MGCCASTSTTPSQQHQQSPRSSTTTTKPHESRTPPPSSIEETVKEVMLSSYTVSANFQQKQEYTKIGKPAIVQNKEEQQSPYRINQKGVRNNTKEEIFDALSDTSTKATVAERKCYYEESITSRGDSEVGKTVKKSPVNLPPRNRSYSNDMGSKRDRVVENSPSWRFERSPGRPGRVNGVPVRMVQGRDPCLFMPGSIRDPGERSGRRSISPGTRLVGMNMGRTPSTRRTNMSPGRVNRNPEPKNNDHRVAEGSGHVVESLENPRVSLECFIFL